MRWHEFVFSEKSSTRLLRHSVFWFAWWMYFTACHYLLEQPLPGGSRPYYVLIGPHIAIKTCLLVIVYTMPCYMVIYFLLPQILNGKRLKPVSAIFCLCGSLFAIAYLMFWHIFPFVNDLFDDNKPSKFTTRFWPAVSLGLLDPLKLIATAGIIKYIKYWWQKQQESKRLEQEKIDAELHLLKAQIQPVFLLTSLNSLHHFSLTASPRSPDMLLKLSDLLSYMLYECDEPLVPIKREVEMMKGYMALEKIRLNDIVETELNIQGDMDGKMIAPFLLLPFIENSFKESSTNTGKAWINMDITIEDSVFIMKLTNGVSTESSSLKPFSENGLMNVRKRLNLIYPQRHDLKITQEREILFVLLKIQLMKTRITEPTVNKEMLLVE